MTHPDHLASDDAANLARLLDASPGLAAAAGHVRSFAGLMTRLQGLLALEDWLTAVEAGDQPGLRSFARGIRRDQQAVTAGLALPFSSGALEGKNCKIKYLKRLMYGRRTSTCYFLTELQRLFPLFRGQVSACPGMVLPHGGRG